MSMLEFDESLYCGGMVKVRDSDSDNGYDSDYDWMEGAAGDLDFVGELVVSSCRC